MKRSHEEITEEDLDRLLALARSDIQSFFRRNHKYTKQYEGKESLVALVQGAALHYINKTNGVKDFDVWFFYPKKKLQLPYRRRGVVDFGKSKFGVHPDDTGYKGRRVDALMRSEKSFNINNPEKALHSYLSLARTKTAKLLSQKAVVGLWPNRLFGKVLWPPNHAVHQNG